MNDISKGWQPGPELPDLFYNAVLVQYKESVVLVGRYGGVNMYQLSSPDGTWIEMKQTFPIVLEFFIAFLIPEELIDCKKT